MRPRTKRGLGIPSLACLGEWTSPAPRLARHDSGDEVHPRLLVSQSPCLHRIPYRGHLFAPEHTRDFRMRLVAIVHKPTPDPPACEARASCPAEIEDLFKEHTLEPTDLLHALVETAFAKLIDELSEGHWKAALPSAFSKMKGGPSCHPWICSPQSRNCSASLRETVMCSIPRPHTMSMHDFGRLAEKFSAMSHHGSHSTSRLIRMITARVFSASASRWTAS